MQAYIEIRFATFFLPLNDIDIERALEKCSEKEILTELLNRSSNDRLKFRRVNDRFNVEFLKKNDSNNNIWPESMKAIDYLNQVRMGTIEELRKAQEDCLQYYKINYSQSKAHLNSIDDLFADNYFFQFHFKQKKKRLCPFIFILILVYV
jgi:hypothetical protein